MLATIKKKLCMIVPNVKGLASNEGKKYKYIKMKWYFRENQNEMVLYRNQKHIEVPLHIH